MASPGVIRSTKAALVITQAVLPALISGGGIDEKTFNNEREILYQILFDMKKDVTELKSLVNNIMQNGGGNVTMTETRSNIDNNLYPENSIIEKPKNRTESQIVIENPRIEDTEEFVEESLSLADKEREMIIKALAKHNNKRKYAAQDLGISERTLYRKIKEYDI